MNEPAPLRGIWPAVVTPLDERFDPNAAKAAQYYAELLQNGCDGLNVLGTTGEAMSLSARQRRSFLQALVERGIPPGRMMAGSGAASLEDAVELTACTVELGLRAALVMPPFFFRDATDEGVVRFFEALLQRTAPPPRHVLLYNFPAMSGIAFELPLLRRLTTAFPDAFGGLKDSSNDRELQREIVAAYPSLRVFPSSEVDLPQLEALGAAGCISATVALSSEEAARAFVHRDARAAQRVACRRRAFTGIPLIAGVRHLLARKRDDASWERMLPPLSPLPAAQAGALREAFSRCA